MVNNKENRQKENVINADLIELKIQEEQLEISKELVQTGNVDMHVESITEEKTITVPITRKELVIEKNTYDEESRGKRDGHPEIIRIPLSEERIEVIKHPVILEDVSVYKNKFQKNEHIEETIKKEKVNIKTSGDVIVNEKLF